MKEKNNKILLGIYKSSWGISVTTLAVVAVLEVFMMVYSFINPSLYGSYLWRYRGFYIFLLSAAVIYISLNLYVKKDFENKYRLLNIANPLCAVLFFIWALGITYSDKVVTGAADATVFMTFSLTVPLSFYLFPSVFSLIAIVADGFMLYLVAAGNPSVGPILNITIYFIFQLVLGISFLRLKMHLAERIVKEQENAVTDVLTGCSNRRAYEEDLESISAKGSLTYLAIDINELKEVNDSQGHEAGDRLIIGAARCLEQSFGAVGRIYRVGGDEFAVLASADVAPLLPGYEEDMKRWSQKNGLTLSTSYGYASCAEYPENSISQLARIADERMYAAKARYYQAKGKVRRRQTPGTEDKR